MKNIFRLSFLAIIFTLVAGQNSFAQDDIIFRKHLVTNGVTGLYYGIAADIIFGLDGAASVGIPVITSGVSVVAPLLFNSDNTIDYDAMVLQGHGKTIGWAHGISLGTIIMGEYAFDGSNNNSNNYKLTVGLGALTSIGMGILGNSLAKNNDWADGRVNLYRHYGWLGPYTGFSLAAAFSDEPRLFGASVILFGAGGYFLADKVYNWNEFSRGEVRSIQTLSALNMGLGWGIFADIQANRIIESDYDFKRAEFLIPAAGALAGTILGQYYLKNTNLTPQQGMLTAYSATGGAVIGLGIALLIESEEITPYYLLPYVTGLGSYILSVELLRKNNGSQALLKRNDNNFHVSFMPQNLFLNNKIENKGFMVNGQYIGMQPLFAASLKF